MSGVDNRIVTMQFNNRQFEQNAATSLSTLQKLKQNMDFGKVAGGTIRGLGTIQSALGKLGLKTPFGPMITMANKGLTGIGGVLDKLGIKNPFKSGVAGAGELQRAAQGAAGPGGLGMLEGGVTGISNKFLALSTIAITALSNITTRAISAGAAFAKSFTVAPIMDGLHEYETTLQSIQTVQANTDQPLKKIEASLQDLNAYSDTTIYNFGEMAKNVGTFTAAGINLKDSVASIKGIANVAALSGSNSQQAAGAMYQLSQAIAAGKVGAQDWNSVVNAGMAGKKLQTALARTAEVMGKLDKSAITTSKSTGALQIKGESFKNSIMAKPGQESWLSSGVLVNTLASLDGRFSVAYQKAQLTEKGVRRFTDAQIKSNMAEARANLEKKLGHKFSTQQYADLRQMAEASTKAAQDVKTLGQVFDIAKETIGSGWAASFKNIFGDLKQSKELFTGMSNGLGDIIRKNALARNKLLKAWSGSKIGGRSDLIDGLKNAFQALMKILGPIKQGFRDIFPAKTAGDLRSMTVAFVEFTKRLIPSKDTMANLRDISAGFFAVFGIGKTILGGVITMFKTMFTSVGGGQGHFLDFAASIGQVLQNLNRFLKNSGVVTDFFSGLGTVLSVPLAILKGLGKVIAGIFHGFDKGAADKMGGAFDGIGKHLSGLEKIGQNIGHFFSNLGSIFGKVGKVIGSALAGIGDVVAKAFTPETFQSTLAVINTTLLGAIVLLIKNFFNKGVKVDLTGGLFDGIKQTLGEATGAFANMQKSLKADILLKLAFAIGVMALSLLVLSGIDPKALATALAAMTGGFAVLIGAMATMMKVMGPASIVQLYVISSAMTKMALSILLLAFALKTLASINFGDMLRGLLGLAIAMKIMTKTMPILAANSKGMGKAAFSMILMGIALNILAVALKIFATMSWEEMAKGMLMLVGTLGALALAFKMMPPLQAEALGLLALGVALNLIGVALKIFATMSPGEMAKSLIMLAGALDIIGLSIRMMPKTMLLQAAALLVVAGALVIMAGALKILGSFKPEQMSHSLIMLAASLIILAVGLQAIGVVGAVGALGLLAAAAALAIFAPIMLAFGAMDWSSILKSLVELAGIFVILGIAGAVLGPVVPVLLGLGLALLLLGAGIALIGVGAMAVATAIGILVAAGSAGIQIFIGYLKVMVSALPSIVAAFAKAFVGFVVAIGTAAPQIAVAAAKLMNKLLDQILKALPKIGRVMLQLVNLAINVVAKSAPRLANAGLKMLNGLLQAVAKNIGRITTSATNLIVKFAAALGNNAPKLANAGVKLIIKLINATSGAIDKHSGELGRAGGRLGVAIIKGVIVGIGNFAHEVATAAVNAAKHAVQAAKDFIKSHSPSKLTAEVIGKPMAQGMAVGIDDHAYLVADSSVGLAKTAMSALSDTMSGLSNSLEMSPDFNPTISPVLDLTALTQEANKMSDILATAPIMPTVSYQTAADISALTSAGPDDGTGGSGGSGGDTTVTLEQHLHSPKPIDSVESYRAGKTLISLAKEALTP